METIQSIDACNHFGQICFLPFTAVSPMGFLVCDSTGINTFIIAEFGELLIMIVPLPTKSRKLCDRSWQNLLCSYFLKPEGELEAAAKDAFYNTWRRDDDLPFFLSSRLGATESGVQIFSPN